MLFKAITRIKFPKIKKRKIRVKISMEKKKGIFILGRRYQ